jgi:cell fate regulator YaaT (PSP1 superfamily)
MVINTANHIAAVRFHKIGKLYHFDISAHPELMSADYVIVETARGRQLGQIMGMVGAEQISGERVKAISRPATARDLMMKALWEAKEVEALITCREAGQELTQRYGVKFVKARYNYDGSMLAFLYTSEDTNIDTSRLRRRLEHEFNTRVELRRIGARDAAKLLGEYGACGAPRCCATHLTEFSPISIRMAKAQGISLNPSEITGMCGRLRCCLIYEYEQYIEANKSLPRKGKWIGTPHGEARVTEVNSLKNSVTIYIEGQRYEVAQEDIVPVEELRALQDKARQGCSREGEAGPCECGARTRSGMAPDQAAQARYERPGDTPSAVSDRGEQRQARPPRHEERPRSSRPAGADERGQHPGRSRRSHRRGPRKDQSAP